MKKPQTVSKTASVQPVIAAGMAPTGKSTGELVRESNRWRDNYNPLRGLVINKVIQMLEAAERGDFAELQLTMRKAEKRYPVLKGLKARRLAALEKLDWDIKVCDELPDGATDAMAEAQRKFLRSRYELIENLTEAISFLVSPEFRGYAILQKHRVTDGGPNDGAVRELHWLPQEVFSRDGTYGDFYYNQNSLFGIGIDTCAALLGEANRIGGEQLPREEFVIREAEAPLYEIALIGFVAWLMGRKDWAAFTEIFGLPNGVAIMPANIPPGKEDEYRTSAEKIAQGVSGALPNGSDIKFPTASVRGEAPFKTFCDAQDSDVVLAGTGGRLSMLTAERGGLGDGPAREHADAFDEIAQADARKINAILQRDFDKVELAAEFPDQPALAYFELSAVEDEDATVLANNVQKLEACGLETDPDEVGEKIGLRLTRVEKPQPTIPNAELNPLQNRESDGHWITTENGSHVFIAEGETEDEAIQQRFSGKQTDSEQFKKWFGKSKVVDEKGAPLRVFHGTTKDFDAFDKKFATKHDIKGFYFSGSNATSDIYATGQPGARVIPAYVSLQNPATFDDVRRIAATGVKTPQLHTALKKAGYDGVYDKKQNIVIAFEPTQIKSAIGNSGAFNPKDKRITNRDTSNDAQIELSARDALLPILNSLEAIRKIDDETQQREAAAALLRNIPHLETVILQNRALANKLMPELVDAFIDGLKGGGAVKNRILNDASSQPRDNLGRWVDDNGGGLSEKDNMQRGQKAMDRAIRQKTSVQKAMYRQEVGQIDFPYGTPGDKDSDFSGGHGVSHIIAKHGEANARHLPEVLAKGKISENPRDPENKKLVSHGDYEAALVKENTRKAWLLTGFRKQVGR